MGVQLTIENGAEFSWEDLKGCLPHSKAVREHEMLKNELEELREAHRVLYRKLDYYESVLCTPNSAQWILKGGVKTPAVSYQRVVDLIEERDVLRRRLGEEEGNE